MISFLGFKLQSINVTAWVLLIQWLRKWWQMFKVYYYPKKEYCSLNLLLHWASNSNSCARKIESVSQEPFDSFMSSTQWFSDPVHEFQNYGLSVFWFHLTRRRWCFFFLSFIDALKHLWREKYNKKSSTAQNHMYLDWHRIENNDYRIQFW